MNLFKCVFETKVNGININEGDIWQARIEEGRIVIKDTLMAFPVKELEVNKELLINNFMPMNLGA